MKVITKLLFVALLIGVALSLPSKVRASGPPDGWVCNWSAYGQCNSELQQWMAGCTQDCTEDKGGGPTQVCSAVPYLMGCEPIPGMPGYQECDYVTDNECFDTQSNAASCVQGCIEQFNEQYNGCIDTDCYQP